LRLVPRLEDIDWLQRLRLSTLTVLGRHEAIFTQIAAVGDSAETLVKPTTDLCVEAPPRSANSFFVVGFRMANPDAHIAHHHHVPAQILTAIRLNVPRLTILRNPIDSALAKAAPMGREFLIGTTLHRWLSFWETLSPLLQTASPVLFEHLVADPRAVIDRLNATYGTTFSREFPAQDEVFSSIEASRRTTHGDDAASPNVPDDRTHQKENTMRALAEGHRLAQPALRLYADLRRRIEAITY